MLMELSSNISSDQIWKLLESIPDPEIPVINIVELGIVREVKQVENKYVISITPTYSGCPAMHMIELDIFSLLKSNGVDNVVIQLVYHPAWTTDWIDERAKKKLKEYGIAPPNQQVKSRVQALFKEEEEKVQCPHCDSFNTELISQFGSTACKALYKCNDCLEPFDYFKCI